MASVFETRLIGNIGKDANSKTMERGVIAINFPVAHNRNWKDKRTGESKTKTTWINCTIWKKEGANLGILEYLKKGTLVELIGTPVSKAYILEDQSIKSEIRLNVSSTNILRTNKTNDPFIEDTRLNDDQLETNLDDFSIEDFDF
jgi:single-strand DNA-binding protein